MKKISTGDSMCGRYSIYESMDHYLKELAPTSALRAKELARECCLDVSEFVWYPVGREVGNVRNKGAELIDPVC